MVTAKAARAVAGAVAGADTGTDTDRQQWQQWQQGSSRAVAGQ